jgi:hypothetical protein
MATYSIITSCHAYERAAWTTGTTTVALAARTLPSLTTWTFVGCFVRTIRIVCNTRSATATATRSTSLGLEAYNRSEKWLACGPHGEDEGRDTGVPNASERTVPGSRCLDGLEPYKRWYQRLASVGLNNMPVKEQYLNTGVSIDPSLASGGNSDSRISNRVMCH